MKIAFSGTQSTGKTTSVYESAKDYKSWNPQLRIELLTEVARRNPFQLLNKDATENSQSWMFHTQIQEEINLTSCSDLLICDRSIIDYVAYTYYLFPYLGEKMFDFCKYHIETYDKIILKTIDRSFQVCHDGIRESKDEEYRKQIEDYLIDFYIKLLKLGKDFKLEII